MPDAVTERVIFSGRVQGVGFRATTLQIAQRWPIAGYVRNLRDGSVELVAQGAEQSVGALVEAIQARFERHILNTTRGRIEALEMYDGFEIRY